MVSQLIYALDVIAIAIIVIIVAKVKSKTAKGASLPPGPPAEPILGHARIIPQKHQAEFYHEMRKIYGDVLHFNVLGKSIVVLNSAEAAVDLLEKRSSIYSDRPPLVMFKDILGMSSHVGFMGYNKRFQKHRKLFHSVFSKAQNYTFEGTQTKAAQFLVKELIEAQTPEAYDGLVRRYATTLVMKIAYGYQIMSEDDEYVKIAVNCSAAIARSGSPGTTPPDVMPILRHIPAWIPGAWWSKFGRDWRYAVDDLYNIPFERVQKELENGTAQPSFVATHLTPLMSKGVPTQDDIDDIRGAAGSIYGAGMETTWDAISMFIFAMTLFPDKQQRAQQEMDTVVGRNRLPEFSDRESLPYLEAVLQEVLRWYPVLPLGVPHRVMEDDVYKGMSIPKGSVIIANALSMAWDDKVYSDPTTFYPERFLPKSAGGNEEPYSMGTFGFGRRICPGRHVADASVWIVLATMISAITISKAKDENGLEITPEIAFEVALAAKPKDFKCVMTPRSELATLLVTQGASIRA